MAAIAFPLFCFFLIAGAGIIFSMFFSLAKQGDERRKTIIEKASTGTFIISVLYLLLCIAERIYLTLSGADLPPEGINPFVMLTVIAFVYAAELFYYKKKYGD